MADKVLAPGATIGILGGGQLGRMLALAAARLGMKTHVYCPDPDSPAFEVTPHRTIASYDDEKALTAFAAAVDVVTYEFENVPVTTAHILEKLKPLAPNARALAISQDRLAEKEFLTRMDVAVSPFRSVGNLEDLHLGLTEVGMPAVLKTTRLGYDGKGQRLIKTASDATGAFAALGSQALVIEAFVPFSKEISVIIARNGKGEAHDYDPAENVHENHILKTSTVPADIADLTAKRASRIAHQIAGALDYVGVMGVEFFVVPGENGQAETLLVNEIAPRVHNSGHWTEAVCLTEQFEQHIRAICNWSLGNPSRMADVVMENLIGNAAAGVPSKLERGDQPHIYGKSTARPGRKMGHINHIAIKSQAF
jgi:5-(carboxyamino)imidazole ribonucleotide synthase